MVYGYLLALPLHCVPDCPVLPATPSGKQGSLEEKKHIGVRVFIYENCDLISCCTLQRWTTEPGPNHIVERAVRESAYFKYVSVCGDRSFLIAAASPSVARSISDLCKASTSALMAGERVDRMRDGGRGG